MFYWFLIGVIGWVILRGLLGLAMYERLQRRPQWVIALDTVVAIFLLIGCLLWL